MVTPQAIMFEPTLGAAAPARPDGPPAGDDTSVGGGAGADAGAADTATSEDSITETRPEVDEDLQKHRMIVPLDIVTSITISQTMSLQTVDTRSVSRSAVRSSASSMCAGLMI